MKLAGGKTTWPGRKEVYRHPEWREDVVQLAGEPAPEGYTRLLRPVMRQGRIVPGSLPPLWRGVGAGPGEPARAARGVSRADRDRTLPDALQRGTAAVAGGRGAGGVEG